jgi:HEAT repeat protein
MLGYAMALHAWVCGDPTPGWIDDLRHDAADACSKGLAYLRSTEDSLLRPDNLHSRPPELSTRHLLHAVEHGSPSETVAALWSLAGRDREADEIAPAVVRRLNDRRPGIRAEAARTLARLGRGGEAAVPVLLDRLSDPELEVRVSAAYALGRFHLQPELAVMELIERLDDSNMIETVAWALAQFGPSAASAMPRLLASLKTALGRNDPTIDYLVYAIRAISPSPEEEIRELIASCDDDVQCQAEGILPAEHEPIPIPPGGQDWSVWTGGVA